jgi:hypothetical protein
MANYASASAVLKRLVEHSIPRFTTMNQAWAEFLQWAAKRLAVDTGKRPEDLARAQLFIDAERDAASRDDPAMQAEAEWFAAFEEQKSVVSAVRKWVEETGAADYLD